VPEWGGEERNELFDGGHRNGWMHEHYIGGRGCQGDGGKILEWIVGNFRIEAGVDDVAGANNHDGVAVRSRVRSNTHAKISTSAWLVLDVELLTETA